MSEPHPRPDAPPKVPRNPIGWIVLGLLFAYLIFGATKRSSADDPRSRIERYTSQLENCLDRL